MHAVKQIDRSAEVLDAERMSGPDALMLNMESASTPMHTLKVAVLDTSRRGRPLDLTEIAEADAIPSAEHPIDADAD